MMGIAYQAIWYAHSEAKLADKMISIEDIYRKYIVLMKHYKSRTRKRILRVGWPSDGSIASYLSPPVG